ncbi:MAG TPA: CDP-alcohol phosphatidyltransferase family protein [Vicinamibacterales bacterium]|nr:CDP-alcohol phosphatidyltransferase family protein [Vicinamibacterales bacterium]
MTSPLGCLHPRNLLTYASLLCAVFAVASATRGSAAGAGTFIALSVIADTCDGRFARLFGADATQRSFGSHLDSLSDAIAFGIAPVVCAAVLIASAAPASPALLWWLAAFCYAACAVTRLGFYHLPHASASVFIGLPVPVAALIWTTALLWGPAPAVSAAVFLTTGAAMVVPLPISRPSGLRLALFILWPAVVAGVHSATLVA